MKIEKTNLHEKYYGITLKNTNVHDQIIWFDNPLDRDMTFRHWSKAIEELEASKAIFRPVYENKDGHIRILSLRYTSPEEVIRIDKLQKEHFPKSDYKLISIYNEAEHTFSVVHQNVNF